MNNPTPEETAAAIARVKAYPIFAGRKLALLQQLLTLYQEAKPIFGDSPAWNTDALCDEILDCRRTLVEFEPLARELSEAGL